MKKLYSFFYDLGSRKNFKFFHIPAKFFEQFDELLVDSFQLNIYHDSTLIGSDFFHLTSGQEIYLPKKFLTIIGYPPTGELTFELPIDEIEEERIIKNPNIDSTEKDAIVKSRIGQGKFRSDLIIIWNGCSVTNEKNFNLL